MDKRIDYNAGYTAVKVAENRSFVRASEQLRIPVSTVSARVQALERSLGVTLFQRSTRRVRLTEAGERFMEHAIRGSEAFEDAVKAAAHLAERPRGVLRVVAPALFARHLLPDLLPHFLGKYPDLTLAFDAVNTLPDLVECGADIGIGVGATRSKSYVRRLLASFSQAIYASPQFVARWGNLAKPGDLMARPLLSIGARPGAVWVLVSGSQRCEVKVNSRVSVSDVSAIHRLALAGIGAALLPQPLCQEDLRAGTLVNLLPAWKTQPVQVAAYYPRRRPESKNVAVFLDYLSNWFSRSRPA